MANANARSAPTVLKWLWTAARRSKCLLRVPDTFLFESGRPTRWLRTDKAGYLVQGNFGDDEPLNVALDTVLSFPRPPEALPSCRVFYSNGDQESLEGPTLSILIRHEEWLVQIAAIQANVSAQSCVKGIFSAESSSQANRNNSDMRFNLLTKQVARFLEASQEPRRRWKVVRLHADLAIDSNSVLWFLHTSEAEVKARACLEILVYVCHSHAPSYTILRLFVSATHTRRVFAQPVQAKPRDPAQEAACAAEAAGVELRALLRQAESRGHDVASSFAHFDKRGLGHFDVRDFRIGLEEVGIELQPAAVQMLYSRLCAGRPSAGLREFAGFCRGVPQPLLRGADSGYFTETAQGARANTQESVETNNKHDTVLSIISSSNRSTELGRDKAEVEATTPRSEQGEHASRFSSARDFQTNRSAHETDTNVAVEPQKVFRLDAETTIAYRALGCQDAQAATVVVLPDITQTLDTLEKFFAPLVQSGSSRIRVLAIKFPGQAGTEWARSSSLNNEFLASALGQLLLSFRKSGEWRDAPWVLVGVGNGANIGTCFVTLSGRQALFSSLLRKLQCAILVNAFAYRDRRLSNSIERLLRMQANASSHERRQHLCSLLFSSDYLAQSSKASVLEEFYSTRNAWQSTDIHVGDVGIIRGMLDHTDLRPYLGSFAVPTILVQATDNAFVLPSHVECFISAHGKEAIASTVQECLSSPVGVARSHIVWLRSGHEVMQERRSFLIKLFGTVIDSVGERENSSDLAPTTGLLTRPSQELLDEDVDSLLQVTTDNCSSDRSDSFEPLSSGLKMTSASAEEEDTAESKFTPRQGSAENIDGGNIIPQESAGDVSSFPQLSGSSQHGVKEYDGAEESSQPRANRDRDRRAKELKAARRREQEERERHELQQRMEHAEKLRAEAALKAEEESQKLERDLLATEDALSGALRRAWREEDDWKIQRDLANARVQELRSAREVEVSDGSKHRADSERAARREARRKRLDDVRMKYAVMSRDSDVETHVNGDLAEVAPGAARLRMDVLQIRQQKAVMVKRYRQVAEKAERVRSQLNDAKSKLRESQLAASSLERKAQGRGRHAREAKKEMVVVARACDEFGALVRELTEQDKMARAELATISSSIQRVIVVQTRKNKELRQVHEKLITLTRQYADRSRERRHAREDVIIRRSDLRQLRERLSSRHAQIIDETERAVKWPSKFIDSSVWQSGVKQRIKTVELQKYLQKETSLLSSALERIDNELDGLGDTLRETDAEIVSLQQQQATLQSQLTLVEQVVRILDKQTTRPGSTDDENEHEIDGELDEATSSGERLGDFAGLVREKAADERSLEEKEWVSYDMLLNPSLYNMVNQLDQESYDYDEAYRSKLTESDLRRICILPEELNLALPFLNSPVEVSAHQLLQRYTFERGEARVRELDKRATSVHLERHNAKLTVSEHLHLLDPLQLPRSHVVQKLEDVPVVFESSSQILLKTRSMSSLFTVQNMKLGAREGRVHDFFIPDNSIYLNICATIVFKGAFDVRGYVLGRMSAALYWVCPSTDEMVPVGWTPQADVSLCSPDSFGRLVIKHTPGERALPVLSGKYQLVVGAASLTEYSVSIKADEACTVRNAINNAITESHNIQERAVLLKKELADLTMSMRLADRKLHLVQGMVHEAENKCEELELSMARLTRILEMEEDEEVTHDEVVVINERVAKLEVDFTKWVRLVSSRREEHVNIKKGIDRMAELKRAATIDRNAVGERLTKIQKITPTIVALLDGDSAALRVSREIGCKDSASMLRWSELSDGEGSRITLTPAEKTRRKFFKGVALDGDEEQWVELDKILNAQLYKEVDEAMAEQTKSNSDPVEENELVNGERFQQYTIDDLQRYVTVSAQELSREELIVRKLLLRFHDRRPTEVTEDIGSGIRSKHERDLGEEETAWLTYDAILHPEARSRSETVDECVALSRAELLVLFATENPTNESAATVQGILRKFASPSEILCIHRAPSEALSGQRAHVRHDTRGPEIITDVDQRCRVVLAELDRANASQKKKLDSHVLHGTAQRFPVGVLRKELGRELDRLLQSQVFERENAAQQQYLALVSNAETKTYDSDYDSDDVNEAEAHTKKGSGLSSSEKRPILVGAAVGTLPPGACRACLKPCSWTSPIDVGKVLERTKEVQLELEAVKATDHTVKFMESRVALSVVRGGSTRMARSDLLSELQSELTTLNRQYRLHLVDKELHDAYASSEEFIETTALHGYRQMQWTHNAISALEQERTRILANEMAMDMIDETLDWMLEGWLFGERKSDLPMLGYVPSIKSDGPLNAREARELKDKGVLSRPNADEADERIDAASKWEKIASNATNRVNVGKAVRQGSELSHQLNETENALQFGLFMITLMYFRAMTLLKRASDSVSGRGELLALGSAKAHGKERSTERLKMDREAEKLNERQRRLKRSMARAESGAMRRRARERQEQEAAQSKLREKLLKIKAEAHASLQIQSVFRGHLGRLAASKWAIKKTELDAKRNLEYAAAAAIQRTYRGHRGRLVAEDKRLEMAEFIKQMRAQEAAEEEAEYWRTHTIKQAVDPKLKQWADEE